MSNWYTEDIFHQTIIIEPVSEETKKLNGIAWRAYLKEKTDIFGTGNTANEAVVHCIKAWSMKVGLPSTPKPKF